VIKQLLALPLLLPLGVALFVGLLNLSTPCRLRFLIWSSPSLSLGSWILLGAGGGAALSAAAFFPQRRRVEQLPWQQEVFTAEREPRTEPKSPPNGSVWPERDPQSPAPTVSVPFRVVRERSKKNQTPAPDSDAAKPTTVNGADWDDPPELDW